MTDSTLVSKRIDELNSLYEKAKAQLSGAERTLESIKNYADVVTTTGNLFNKSFRMSNEAWRKRASEMIKELIKIDHSYPNFNSVLATIYIKLRNDYGIVLDQLRKEFRYNNDTLRYPSAFEAISDNDTVRDIFDSLLVSLFPENYFEDEVLSSIENKSNGSDQKVTEENIIQIILPLAIKLNDHSFCYVNTYNLVCENMDCAWHNLKTRFMKKNNLQEEPSTTIIILNNDSVFRKFKKTVKLMVGSEQA